MKKIATLLAVALMLCTLYSFKPLERVKSPETGQKLVAACLCERCEKWVLTRKNPERGKETGTAAPPTTMTFFAAEKLPLFVEIGALTARSGENPAATWKWLCGAGTKDNDDNGASR